MNTPLEQVALEQMKPLCQPLHDALSFGAERAAIRMREDKLEGHEHMWLRHHWARVVAHQWILARPDDLGSWRALPHRPNTGSLQLVNGGLTIRVLRGMDGGIPAPGRNAKRRAFYVQPTLTGLSIQDAIPGLAISNFIATWEEVDVASHEVAIRMYRTTGAFRFGGRAKSDLAFWLPDVADDLDSLTFDPSDEGIELDIPEEESGEQPARG